MRVSLLLNKVLVYLLAICMCAIILFPFYWVLISSLKPTTELMTTFGFIPQTLTLQNYEKILFATPLLNSIFNSTVLALLTTAMSVITSCLASYSILRFRYKGKNFFSGLIIIAYMFQGFFLVLPLAQIMTFLGLYNTLYGLSILHSLIAIPFCVYILRSFFETIPVDLEEAALIDGCTKLRAFVKITLPLSLPGVITAAIYSFLLSWNEYTFAYVMLAGETYRTVPLYLSQAIAHYAVDWGTLLSGSIIVSIPGFIIAIVLGRYIQKGIVAGALKG